MLHVQYCFLISIVLPFLYGWAKNDLDLLHVCVAMNFFKAENTLHFPKYPDVCGQGQRLSYSVVVSQGDHQVLQ